MLLDGEEEGMENEKINISPSPQTKVANSVLKR
jgi:hypothetical protein